MSTLRLNRTFRAALVGLALLWPAAAFGQLGSPTASVSGVVVDASRRTVPDATVTVTDVAMSQAFPVVLTNQAGTFSVAALPPGTYRVTVSRPGFKTTALNGVKVAAGVPADLGTITMDVGAVNETVTVTASAELVQTRSTAISSTLDANQIRNLPLITRNVLNFITFLPGVDVGGVHNQRSNTQIAGLPQ